jgi:hypothetical protein
MESKLVEIEMLDCEDLGFFCPHIKIRVSNGSTETSEFYARIDTGADLTIIPASYVEKLYFTLYNSPITLRWGNGDTTEHMTPWTGFVRFSNNILLRASRGLIFNRKSEVAFLGMDILSQGTLLLTPKGGYFLIQ